MLNFARCHCATALLGAIALAGGLACAKVNPDTSGAGTGGAPGGLGGMTTRRDGGTGFGGTPTSFDGAVDLGPPITDFPPDPILGTPTTTSNAPTLFGGTPRSGSAPCVLSPQTATLMPRNWLRPRFEWRRAADENLFEIQLVVARFPTPLRIYTDDPTSYKLDAAVWDDLRRSVNDEPITVSIRAMTVTAAGTQQQGPSAAAQTTFTIAPVDAPGKIVYWSLAGDASNGTGMLKGFGIGEEGVRDVLTPTQVMSRTTVASGNNAVDGCIGCHTATPGGESVQFVFGPPMSMINANTYFNNISDIRMGSEGTMPSYVTPGAFALIRTLRGIPAFSPNLWADGNRMVLLTDAHEHGDLLWVQLDADGTSGPISGTIARTGDPGGATEPTFSHEGSKIVYVSSSTADFSIHDGRLNTGPADLYAVPYSNRAGGAALPLGGAADPNFTEYYPAFSPNDDLIAFTRISSPATTPPSHPTTYGNSNSEIFVVPSGGGAAVRLVANDPPACLFRTSPGLTNDWSKWSPEATTAANGKTYNWLTFSSTRSGTPQLYITAIVTQPGAAPATYPALYLWNQPATESNHTPSWDNFKIPPVVIVP